jgi:hypothetical protein
LSVIKPKSQTAQALMEYLGLKYSDKWNRASQAGFYFLSDMSGKPFVLKGFDQAILFSFASYAKRAPVSISYKGRDLTIEFDKSTSRLVISEKSNALIVFQLADLLRQLGEIGPAEGEALTSSEAMSIDAGKEPIQGRLLVKEIRGIYEQSHPVINNLEGLILLK